MHKNNFPKCKICNTELIEEVDGIPLGFLSCPNCANENSRKDKDGTQRIKKHSN